MKIIICLRKLYTHVANDYNLIDQFYLKICDSSFMQKKFPNAIRLTFSLRTG